MSPTPSNIKLLESDEPIEEQTLPHYQPSDFYPVHVGELFNERYQVLGKLGYGSKSTIWMCYDISDDVYVTLKVCAAHGDDRSDGESSTDSELACYRKMGRLTTEHEGVFFLRMLEGTFIVASPSKRQHRCFVYKPAVTDLCGMLRRLKQGGMATNKLLKKVTRAVLSALDFLQTELQTIHADVKIDNVLFLVTDNAAFTQVAVDLKSRLVPAKYDRKEKRYIYPSIDVGAHMKNIPWGQAILADLGEARSIHESGMQDYCGIYPDQYRPPEIRLCMKWGSSVDVWAAGVMVWSAFERDLLFGSYQGEPEKVEARHLAQMVGILGPPPLDFLKRSTESLEYWNRDGSWRGVYGVDIQEASLEGKSTSFEGADLTLFVDFMQSMLRWKPEERLTVKQLLKHPFLQVDQDEGDSDGCQTSAEENGKGRTVEEYVETDTEGGGDWSIEQHQDTRETIEEDAEVKDGHVGTDHGVNRE
ncbi:hypothetical protein LTR36_003534 [Oleoguttula mirabilis]|uniref:non-specific serine/threonine protein kinase n=1 Tax=Oleoguttula mirabilis TaxID=1507867 RepID=A0AAV9JIW3_9PEZI|nr:hypothetical protein LTR36_003534 [Oleoguttula mirabilis]